MKLQLPDVTLICADCYDVGRAVVAIEHSKLGCEFGAVKLLTSERLAKLVPGYPHLVVIKSLDSINDYSAFCLKRMHEYVDTSHCLVVQHDGRVLNPAAWEPKWLNYDYTGPLFEQHSTITDESVGSGGFSLRSKRIMVAFDQLCPAWDGSNSFDKPDGKNNWGHEDGVICMHLRAPLINRGFKFALPDDAVKFAFGRNRVKQCQTSFGFHGYCPETEARGVDSQGTIDAARRVVELYAAGHSGPLSGEQSNYVLYGK